MSAPTPSRLPASYAQARSELRAHAARLDCTIETLEHPGHTPAGEALETLVLRLGPAPGQARALLLLQSGTHGVEGYAGAAIQLDLLARMPPLPEHVALLMVFAINPWGFAHDERETIEGVDLNRNAIEHGAAPANPGYEAIAQLVGGAERGPSAALEAWIERSGFAAFEAALALGQYRHPSGLYFGGDAPTHALRCFEQLVRAHAVGLERLAFIDLHTGWGPWAEGAVICLAERDTAELARARACFGELIAPFASDAGPSTELIPRVQGHLIGACTRLLPSVEVTAAALEFGTYPSENDHRVYADRRWLRRVGAEAVPASVRTQIHREFLEHFAPADPSWAAAVLRRARELVTRTLAWL